jgi:nucleoid-associated protein YgaU
MGLAYETTAAAWVVFAARNPAKSGRAHRGRWIRPHAREPALPAHRNGAGIVVAFFATLVANFTNAQAPNSGLRENFPATGQNGSKLPPPSPNRRVRSFIVPAPNSAVAPNNFNARENFPASTAFFPMAGFPSPVAAEFFPKPEPASPSRGRDRGANGPALRKVHIQPMGRSHPRIGNRPPAQRMRQSRPGEFRNAPGPEITSPPFPIIKGVTNMGLFDFVKNIGHKLFTSETQAPAKIAEAIEADNPGIRNLKVDYQNSIASLSGEADSPEALQKAVLIAGNIQGVESVNVDGMKVAGGAQSPAAVEGFDNTEYYVIKSGDTLSKIAGQYYGDANKYPLIFEANREVIKDPNLIFPGQKIRIPPEAKVTSGATA